MNPFFSAPYMARRLYAGPLGPHMDAFAALLRDRGYARRTGRICMRTVVAFGRWLDRRHLGLPDFSERMIEKFVRHRRATGSHERGLAACLRLLLGQLRGASILPPPPAPSQGSQHSGLEQDFARHLAEERGLSRHTLLIRLPIVRRFLAVRFRNGPVRPEALRPHDVARFILRRARSVTPATAQNSVTALRSFFRFLRLRGRISTDLAACVPTVAHWRLASLPQSLDPQSVRSLLKSCDESTPLGRRDHAVLLLLAQLGLRAGEIVGLTLEDLDWEAGELTVRGKGDQSDRLPLPQEAGQALSKYLCDGRPACATRRVFVRMNAPREGFSSSVAVWNIVRRALERCHLRPPRRGAHLLHHSLAREMLRRGASLAEIGDILRHRDLRTTQMYAKVDLAPLGALALPWPGGAQ